MHLPNIHLLIVCYVFISTHLPLVLGFSLSFTASFIHLFTLTCVNLSRSYLFSLLLIMLHSFFLPLVIYELSSSVKPVISSFLHSSFCWFIHPLTHECALCSSFHSLIHYPHFTHLFNGSCSCQFSSSFSSE